MSYHRADGKPVRAAEEFCVPQRAVLRLQPRAAGPLMKELVFTSGPYEPIPFTYDRGLLVIDPRYDTLPVVDEGWESKTV